MSRIQQYFSYKSKSLFEGTQKALALLIVFSQIVAPIGPVFNLGQVHAAGVDVFNQYADVDDDWQNGNLNKNNSAYREGESVPFRVVLNDIPTSGTQTLDIEYDNVDQGKHAYDYLTSFDRSRSPIPCEGVSSCAPGTSGSIPTDPTLPGSITQAPGQISIWNGDISNVEYLSTPGHATDSNKATSIRVTFTASSSDVVFAWGGHIAIESDWGVNEGASSVNGSPYHMRLLAISGSPSGAQDRSMMASAVILLPRIEITKVVEGGDAQPHDFSFNVSPAIDGKTLFEIPEGEDTVVIFDVPDDDYTITENSPTSYKFVDGTGNEHCTFSGSTATASVVSGTSGNVEHALCTFTNAQLPGSITIIKDAQPNSEQLFDFSATGPDVSSFTLQDNGDETDGDTKKKMFDDLTPDTYSFTEDTEALPSWDLFDINCSGKVDSLVTEDEDNKKVTIDLAAGENITCTFVNQQRGTVTVTKQIEGIDTEQVFAFETDIDSLDLSKGLKASQSESTADNGVVPDSYSVTEFVPDGWELTDITCEEQDGIENSGADSVLVNTAEINVEAGETVHCTFTNTEQGSIRVLKNVDVLGDITEGVTDWEWQIGDGPLHNTGDPAIEVVPSNEPYTVSEVPDELQKNKYHVTNVTCTGEEPFAQPSESVDVTVSPGEDVVCTFTNTRDTGTLTLVKHLPNDDGGDATQDNFTPLVDNATTVQGQNVEWGIPLTLVTNTYEANEMFPLPDGYEQTDITCFETGDQDKVSLGNPVPLGLNDDITCSITNDDIAPSLTLIKNVKNDDGGSHNADEWTLKAQAGDETPLINETGTTTGENEATTTTVGAEANKDYTLSESGPDGYDPSSWSCRGGDGDELQGDIVTLDLAEEVTCEITNDDIAPSVQIIKETNPQESQGVFDFAIENTGANIDNFDDTFQLDTDPGTIEILDKTTYELSAGNVVITETLPDGWSEHIDIFCSGVEEDRSGLSVNFNIKLADEITCTFTNIEHSTVTVTKYNDLDVDGTFDPNENSLGMPEPTLANWEFVLESSESECDFALRQLNLFENGPPSYCVADSESSETQTTGSDGTTTFTGVEPGVLYKLSEKLQEGWTLSDITCIGDENIRELVVSEENTYYLSTEPGQNIKCFVGNHQDLVLELDKSNNQTAPQQVGESIIYTLEVSVPENSGTSFNTVVTDLPPKGFEVDNNSWTATSTVPSHNVVADINSEGGPEYSSPGVWYVGTLLPGEVVTLTYTATITNDVSPGEYQDLAFATGQQLPEESETLTYSNLHITGDNPFVDTAVQVIEHPEPVAVFAAAETVTRLPNTGPAWLDAIFVPIALASLYYMFARRKWYKQIGGRI